MATTKRRSRPEPAGWGAYTQLHTVWGELVAHAFPRFGPPHVLEGYPGTRCWCQAKVEILEDGMLIHHHQAH